MGALLGQQVQFFGQRRPLQRLPQLQELLLGGSRGEQRRGWGGVGAALVGVVLVLVRVLWAGYRLGSSSGGRGCGRRRRAVGGKRLGDKGPQVRLHVDGVDQAPARRLLRARVGQRGAPRLAEGEEGDARLADALLLAGGERLEDHLGLPGWCGCCGGEL